VAEPKRVTPIFFPFESVDGLDLRPDVDRENQPVGGIADDLEIGALKRRRHGGAAVQSGYVDFAGDHHLSQLAAARNQDHLVIESLPGEQAGVAGDPQAQV